MQAGTLAGIPVRLGQHKVQDDLGVGWFVCCSSMGVRCWGCHVAAGMEEAIFAQLLIIHHQNLLPEIWFGCNYSNSSHYDVGAVFDNLQSGDRLWIELEIGQLWPVKHRTIISSMVRSVGKQYPVLAQLLLKSQWHVQGVLPSCRFLSQLSSWFSQFSSAGWKELMAVSCHHFFLSKSQFGNSSEIISCRWWGCYPAVSLGPCTWDYALKKDLLLPWICQLFYKITKH